MRNWVRVYNALYRQYEHEVWTCNRHLAEMASNNNSAGVEPSTSSLSTLTAEGPPPGGPRTVDPEAEVIVIHGNLGYDPEADLWRPDAGHRKIPVSEAKEAGE